MALAVDVPATASALIESLRPLVNAVVAKYGGILKGLIG